MELPSAVAHLILVFNRVCLGDIPDLRLERRVDNLLRWSRNEHGRALVNQCY